MASNSSKEESQHTTREYECNTCAKQGGARKCRGCQKVQYCSVECQKADWHRHVIDCNISNGKPVTSAHYLVYAVLSHTTVTNQYALTEWGLAKAMTISSHSAYMLLRVYTWLIKEKKISAMRLHEWRVKGTLVSEIKAVYESVPPEARGDCYAWFLENQFILENPMATIEDVAKMGDGRDKRLWAMLSRGVESERNTTEAMREAYEKLDGDGRDCWELLRTLIDDSYPGPESPLWLKFGFCACPTLQDESKLTRAYQNLASLCPFDKFCDAYSKHSLVALFKKYKIASFPSSSASSIFYTCIVDVLSVPFRELKPVWWLKKLVEIVPKDAEFDWKSAFPQTLEFGFLHCMSKKDTHALLDLYRAFFSSPASNPLALDRARRSNRLSRFFFKDLGMKMDKARPKVYKRLLAKPRISQFCVPVDAADLNLARSMGSLGIEEIITVEDVTTPPVPPASVDHRMAKNMQQNPNSIYKTVTVIELPT
ncbi:hypothetical protein BDY19DRAFT_997764 [Irpex rosettiformis]|uniref:Uncharacterized protein n=1 Tax=Irpex rosettiformis TaxID=378272 RepID=A0ACB8TQS4_9APHY|nr:hypothetical protein BDY19DRAFT_997764 [Irpex rosettiformis]